MIDYYWLKSFTETIQLFIAVLFLIYLRVKYPRKSVALYWLTIFLILKIFDDFYGVINYTSWIEDIVTPLALDYYKVFMFTIEGGMIAAYYLFVVSIHDGISYKRLKDLLYFLPSIIIIPINFLDLTVWSYAVGMYLFLILRVLFASVLCYLWYKKKVKALGFLTLSMIIWNILWFSDVFFHEYAGLISEESSWVLFVLAEVAFTFGIAYFLIQVVSNPKILRTEDSTEKLPSSLLQLIELNLNREMDENKLYRDPELSLNKLADQLGIQATDLTLYLNRVVKMNFNQYLSSFRIEESMKLLEEPEQDLSIEQIMHQVGFNSRSVFNTAFKIKLGMTPSEYKRQNQSQQ